MTVKPTDAPAGLAESGRLLWAAFLAQDAALEDELNPLRFTALNACRAQDRCDVLFAVCKDEPVMLDNGKGQPVAHPAWVEARQQEALVSRLTAALRLPDEASGKRPQKRQVRGVQKPPQGSARDRLRAVHSA